MNHKKKWQLLAKQNVQGVPGEAVSRDSKRLVDWDSERVCFEAVQVCLLSQMSSVNGSGAGVVAGTGPRH